jgi:glycine/D-amino acid oxidase-like deaminating enzyme
MAAAYDIVVIGAGVVGAACAHELTRAGLSVLVLDRGGVAGGTTGRGEGNVLVSDKLPGPELALALRSRALWCELAQEIGEAAEIEPKGGLVVAGDPATLHRLGELAGAQRAAGVTAQEISAGELSALEPRIARDLAGGVFYPQDMQVQPMLAAAQLLRLARAAGAQLRTGCEVSAIDHAQDRIRAVHTSQGTFATGQIVNAAGTWGGAVAALAGGELPVVPRRGFILVTESLADPVLHKVYAAGYVADVASGEQTLQTSTVIEGTRGGTVLIGSSRERVGFDQTLSWPALRAIAAEAIRVFPFLEQVRALRTYFGFRPYCPDHLPVIGLDPVVGGLIHACGHEGAGVGLAPVSGRLVAQLATGVAPELDLTPFAPGRFLETVVRA